MSKIFHSSLEMFKIGVGPSSSHTLGPWRAALDFLEILKKWPEADHFKVHLFGSLAKTGKGHGTDFAIQMGLLNEDPKSTEIDLMNGRVQDLKDKKYIGYDSRSFRFNPITDILFHMDRCLDFHPNGMQFEIFSSDESVAIIEYYSIGGGFIERPDTLLSTGNTVLTSEQVPFYCSNGADLERHVDLTDKRIWEIALENELTSQTLDEINSKIDEIWKIMLESIYMGAHKMGYLPGGLNVKRRAADINAKLLDGKSYSGIQEWQQIIKESDFTHNRVIKWISCFALAVNEENAAFGRIVTAPTNGAAGVIPAVLMYHACFSVLFDPSHIRQFLLTAGQIGVLFKQNATISAAMGGCQAEIGVSSAMAAAGLTECLGGTQQQAIMAAEIAMEHHLGLTCDPIGGLVQIPCIERNTMGAIKAITAAHLALESDPANAKVSLDSVINTMWETAKDMSTKYKETSEGGLALHIPLSLSEC